MLVERELNDYIRLRKKQYGRISPFLSRMEDTVRECCERGVRRREFYTKLEGIENEALARSGRSAQENMDEIAALKAFVINEAFYGEFQQFDRYSCGSNAGEAKVIASRDITKSWLEGDCILTGLRGQDMIDLLEKEKLPILDAISLEDILEWHTATHNVACAFQESLTSMLDLHKVPRSLKDEAGISACVRQHIENIRACMIRSFSDQNRKSLLEAPWSEVYFGLNSDIGSRLTAGGVAALIGLCSRELGVISLLSAGYINMLFKKCSKSENMVHFETSLEFSLRENILGEAYVK